MWRLGRTNWPVGGRFCELWCCRASRTHNKFMSLRKALRPSMCVECVIISSLFFFCLADLQLVITTSYRVSGHSCTCATLRFPVSPASIEKPPSCPGARLGEFKASAPSIYLATTLSRMILVLSPHDVLSCFSFPWLYAEITV